MAFTNQVSFYYRKDLNVTKHGEYKAGVAMVMGDAVKRNDATKEVEIAQTSDEFEGVVDYIMLDYQGSDADRMNIESGKRVRCGVGVDYEIVVKGNHSAVDALNVGEEVGVDAGKFVAVDGTTVTVAVGKVVEKFANGENVIRIY